MIKTTIEAEPKLLCVECGLEIESCTICNALFFMDENIYCDKDKKHTCETCGEKYGR